MFDDTIPTQYRRVTDGQTDEHLNAMAEPELMQRIEH